jgi:amino acid permease
VKCFKHYETDSVGICKACKKAVCHSCLIDTGRGLACSDECVIEVNYSNEIIHKSKIIYSIGSKSKLLPTGILMYFMFSVLFFCWGVYNSFQWNKIDYFTMFMGITFFVIAIIAYNRNKRINLNC